jgi:hypothetical protein
VSILSKLAGTFQTAFQVGKGGPKLKAPTTTTLAFVAADGTTEVQGQILSARINNQTTLLGSGATLQVKDATGTNEVQVQALSARINNEATITAASGAVTVKDATGVSDAKVFAADPLTTDTQGLITVNYYNTNAPTSAAAIKVVAIKSGSYATTYTSTDFLPNTAVVTRAVVVVATALDVGITLEVGTDEAGQAARFQATTDNDTQTVLSYETTPFKTVKTTGGAGTDQRFRVTLSSLPTVGNVTVYLEYVVPSAF